MADDQFRAFDGMQAGISMGAWARAMVIFLAGGVIAVFIWIGVALVLDVPGLVMALPVPFYFLGIVVFSGGLNASRRRETAHGYTTVLTASAHVTVVDAKTGLVLRGADDPPFTTREQAKAALMRVRAGRKGAAR